VLLFANSAIKFRYQETTDSVALRRLLQQKGADWARAANKVETVPNQPLTQRYARSYSMCDQWSVMSPFVI